MLKLSALQQEEIDMWLQRKLFCTYARSFYVANYPAISRFLCLYSLASETSCTREEGKMDASFVFSLFRCRVRLVEKCDLSV